MPDKQFRLAGLAYIVALWLAGGGVVSARGQQGKT